MHIYNGRDCEILRQLTIAATIAKPVAEFKKIPFAVVVACAAGEKSHIDVLRKITNDIIQISTIDSTSIK